MGAAGFSSGQVLRKAADLAHLLVWVFFLSYLSLSTYGRLSVDGPDISPLFLGSYSGHFYTAFWMTLFGVPVFTAVVAVHIGRTSKIFLRGNPGRGCCLGHAPLQPIVPEGIGEQLAALPVS